MTATPITLATNPFGYGTADLSELATQVRRDILRMVYGAESGHPGGPMGAAEYFVALYFNLLRYMPQAFDMQAQGQDVFYLSNGHICAGWYSVLARSGYFPVAELGTFRQLGTRLQGHPAPAEGLPGVRIATGSLGQGLSVALGHALAKRLTGDPALVYCLTGDGELNEGQIWEAAMFATHHKIDNVIVTVDLNFKQIDGDTRDVQQPGDLAAKWRAFGWHVVEIKQGNSVDAVLEGHREAAFACGQGRPVIVLMHTVMGYGVDFMADDYRWHGKPPAKPEFERAMAQLPTTKFGDY